MTDVNVRQVRREAETRELELKYCKKNPLGKVWILLYFLAYLLSNEKL